MPPEVKQGGLAGVRLTALIGYMKGVCPASFSTIRKYPRDVVGVTLSRGQLRKIDGKVAEAYGQRVLEAVRQMFALIHRREEMGEQAFQAALIRHREHILKTATENVPDRCHVHSSCR